MAQENINIISRSVAVTGHRTVENINTAKLEEVFILSREKLEEYYSSEDCSSNI